MSAILSHLPIVYDFLLLYILMIILACYQSRYDCILKRECGAQRPLELHPHCFELCESASKPADNQCEVGDTDCGEDSKERAYGG